MNEVVFRTPVMLGSTGLATEYLSLKVRYRKGDLLHDDRMPPSCQALPLGMVIDLPTTNVAAYVQQFLGWLPLRSDDELVVQLHRLINEDKTSAPLEQLPLKDIDLLTTPWFMQQDVAMQHLISHSVISTGNAPPATLDQLRQQFAAKPLIETLVAKKGPLGKRELKRLEKERLMLSLKLGSGMKPAEIAKKLRVPVKDVYKADTRLRVNLAKAKQAASLQNDSRLGYFYQHSIPADRSVAVQQEVGDYLAENGTYNLSRLKLQQHIKADWPDLTQPSLRQLSHILHADFKLSYRRYNGATAKYKDP